MSIIEESEIPANSLPVKIVEHDKRQYVEIELYGAKKWLLGSPDRRIIDLHRNNNYGYDDVSHDRNWDKFCKSVKRRKIWALVKQINRTIALSQGKVQDIYTVYVVTHGTNQKDGHEEDGRMIGVWRQPKFTKDRDPDTEELRVIGVDYSTRQFDFVLDKDEESVKAIDYLIQHCDPQLALSVAASPDANRSEEIIDHIGFSRASFSELMEMGKQRTTLETIRANRAYFLQLQTQQKTAVVKK